MKIINLADTLLQRADEFHNCMSHARRWTDQEWKEHNKEVYAEFAKFKPLFGLQNTPSKLTSTDKGNLKIAKNELPTITLTMNSARSTVVEGVTYDTCENAGSCINVCVLKHGKGAFNKVQAARDWRTYCFAAYPVSFMLALRYEIMQATEKFGTMSMRLNVNSDLPWWAISEKLFGDLPVQAYDYTKDPMMMQRFVENGHQVQKNYRLIYSFNEKTKHHLDLMDAFLCAGGSVAVVTNRKKGDPVMKELTLGVDAYRVIDGDLTDDRFNDPRSVFVDLYAKGYALSRKNLLVQNVYPSTNKKGK